MKRIAIITLMCVLGTAPIQAGMIAQQEHDFQANNNGHADTLGTGTWHYMYSDTMNPTLGTTGLLVWNSGNQQYDVDGSGDWYPDVKIYQVDGLLTMAPEVSGAAGTRYGVMRWTSGVSGSINVSGTWTHFWPDRQSDGMDVAIYGDGVQKFHTLLTAKDSVDFDFTLNVSPGSVVDYVVGPGAANVGDFDRAYIETTITPVPGAALLGMLGLSAAGVRLRKRARPAR